MNKLFIIIIYVWFGYLPTTQGLNPWWMLKKPVFTSAATQKPVLCYNIIGQKPVKPLETPHASFKLLLGQGPCAQFLYWSSLSQGGIAGMAIPDDGIPQFPTCSQDYFDNLMKFYDTQ